MKRPLLAVTLLYTGGVLLGAWLPLGLVPLCAAAFAAALASVFFSATRAQWLCLALLLAGWGNMVLQTAVSRPDDLRDLVGDQPVIATVRGRMAAPPTQRIYDAGDRLLPRTLAEVVVTEIRRRDNWEPASGRIVVNTPGTLSGDFFRGKNVEITGVLRPPPGPLTEGLFDYRSHLKWRGIYHQLRTQNTNDWKALADSAKLPLSDRFIAWAKQTLALGQPVEDQAQKILWAMALNWDSGMTNEVAEPLMRAGTMHIVAISGLHIALIAGVLIAVLRLVRVPRMACGIVVIPIIWFYAWVTGWQASAIRSTIMTSIIVAGWALKRPSDLLNSLMAAAFIILLWQPTQLFQVGFQLSFIVVLALALLIPPLEEQSIQRPLLVEIRHTEAWCRWLLQIDPLLPRELWPIWKRRALVCVRLVVNGLVVSLAAWIGSLPLIALYFHLFTPGTVLANLIVVPLSNAALACEMFSLFTGAWMPWFAEIMNHSAWFWMQSVLRFSEWVTRLPIAYWYLKAPNATQIAAYYAILLSTLYVHERKWKRRWMLTGVSGALVVLTLGGLPGHSEYRITILHLGGGSAIYADAPGTRDDLLVDCGEDHAADFMVKPFLRAQGVNKLPHLLLTHGDVNNVGGAPMVFDWFHPNEILTSDLSFRSPAYRQAMAQLDARGAQRVSVHRGGRVGPWQVLHPAREDRITRADDGALVLRGNLHGVGVLLASDLGRAGQRSLMEREANLRTDILIGGMPAQDEPFSETFLDAVQPKVIILSTGFYPATEIPKRPLRERLVRRKIPVLYTSDTGSLTLIITKTRWQIRTAENEVLASQAKP